MNLQKCFDQILQIIHDSNTNTKGVLVENIELLSSEKKAMEKWQKK
jgi:hypothetical protein